MNLLITGAWNGAKENIEYISNLGYKVFFLQNEKDDIPLPYDEIDCVICNGLFLYHDINKFTNLKFIQLTSAGFDRVPMDAVNSRGIKIFNARGVYSIPMAEYAVCGVLELYKQSRFFYDNQKQNAWVKHRGIIELFGKNALIVGAGNVGTECAKRFSAFGAHVRGIDLFPREDENYEIISHLSNLNEELSSADVVVLTLPLTDETKHLFNKETFNAMKNGAVLVNIARGAVVDSASLIEALRSGKLAGAVLDVFEEEPLDASSPLWSMENVIVTPHNSFIGDGNAERLKKVIIDNLRS